MVWTASEAKFEIIGEAIKPLRLDLRARVPKPGSEAPYPGGGTANTGL